MGGSCQHAPTRVDDVIADEALYLSGFPKCERFEDLAVLPVLSRRIISRCAGMLSTSSGSQLLSFPRRCRLCGLLIAWSVRRPQGEAPVREASPTRRDR